MDLLLVLKCIVFWTVVIAVVAALCTYIVFASRTGRVRIIGKAVSLVVLGVFKLGFYVAIAACFVKFIIKYLL